MYIHLAMAAAAAPTGGIPIIDKAKALLGMLAGLIAVGVGISMLVHAKKDNVRQHIDTLGGVLISSLVIVIGIGFTAWMASLTGAFNTLVS